MREIIKKEMQEINGEIFEVSQIEDTFEINADEEIEHLLYPFGKEQTVSTENLQALAGFKVEKTIIPL